MSNEYFCKGCSKSKLIECFAKSRRAAAKRRFCEDCVRQGINLEYEKRKNPDPPSRAQGIVSVVYLYSIECI